MTKVHYEWTRIPWLNRSAFCVCSLPVLVRVSLGSIPVIEAQQHGIHHMEEGEVEATLSLCVRYRAALCCSDGESGQKPINGSTLEETETRLAYARLPHHSPNVFIISLFLSARYFSLTSLPSSPPPHLFLLRRDILSPKKIRNSQCSNFYFKFVFLD